MQEDTFTTAFKFPNCGAIYTGIPLIKMSSKVSVSGSMNYVDSDSSSDSEDSVDAPVITKGPLPSRLDLDDDEEELEVFGDAQTSSNANERVEEVLPPPAPASRLIDLMAKSVAIFHFFVILSPGIRVVTCNNTM